MGEGARILSPEEGTAMIQAVASASSNTLTTCLFPEWKVRPDVENAQEFIGHVIVRALEKRASDIHFETRSSELLIRVRIDGVLCQLGPSISLEHARKIIAACKISAGMNIAESRVPQDGKINAKYSEKELDLRVSSLPITYGENIVMRILDKEGVPEDLSVLGFDADVETRVLKVSEQPNGMLISTGPTGSGKSTTQYALLQHLNSPEKKILTVENPVEYQLDGLSQVQVNVKAGLTFAEALRAFLRQDPDIIMVGEMRDLETAEVAIEAALTGHLVLSTLHTNDAPSAVTRLVDMGVEPHLIPDTVTGVLAQRLARRICQHCKEPYEVTPDSISFLGYEPEEGTNKVLLYRGTGCENCIGGYRGRVGIYEFMEMNEEIKSLICGRRPLAEVAEAAIPGGMQTLKQDGLDKVLAGLTTPEEIERVVFTAGRK